MTNHPISRKANIVLQEFENEILIYDLSINKAFCLNRTSESKVEKHSRRRICLAST